MSYAGEADAPQLAVDASGNATAVWSQWTVAHLTIWANRYVPGAGWGAAAQVENNSGDAIGPQVAVGGGGNAFAVWSLWGGAFYHVWANRYVPGAGWGTAGQLENNSGDAQAPKVAADGGGNAFVVWSQSNGNQSHIWADRYVAGVGWATTGQIENNTGNASDAQVAVDARGEAVAVWVQYNGTSNHLWASSYVPGAGWGAAAQLEALTGNAYEPQVAVAGSGNATVVWSEDGVSIWAEGFVAGTGWGAAGRIDAYVGYAQAPQVAVDLAGNAVAVWVQVDRIFASRYVVGTGWGSADQIDTNAFLAAAPRVAVDGSGNAIAMWEAHDGPLVRVQANWYVPGTGWGWPGQVEAGAGDAYAPQVAADGSANAVAVWVQNDVDGSAIWANRFVDHYPSAISLSSPFEGFSTNVSTVWVRGVAEAGAAVSVNGFPVSVAADGSFAIPLALTAGGNLVNATACCGGGRQESAYANVSFNDPVPALEQDLAGARANLTAAQARVAALEGGANATQAELAAAQADLASAQVRLSSLDAKANATQLELDAARANLTAAQAREAGLASNATAAMEELSRAEARITALEANGTAAPAPAPSGDAGLALLLAAAGIGVGALGCALALRGRGPVADKEAAASRASERRSPPPP